MVTQPSAARPSPRGFVGLLAAGVWDLLCGIGSSTSWGLLALLLSLSFSLPDSCFLSPFRLPLLFTFRSSYFSLSLCLCALSFLPSLQSSRSHPVQFIPERLNSPSLSVSSSILSVDNLFSSIGEIKAKHRELISPVLATGRGGDVTECHSACP